MESQGLYIISRALELKDSLLFLNSKSLNRYFSNFCLEACPYFLAALAVPNWALPETANVLGTPLPEEPYHFLMCQSWVIFSMASLVLGGWNGKLVSRDGLFPLDRNI